MTLYGLEQSGLLHPVEAPDFGQPFLLIRPIEPGGNLRQVELGPRQRFAEFQRFTSSTRRLAAQAASFEPCTAGLFSP